MQKPYYFFSYSRKDADFVKRLAADLRNLNVNVWLDQLDISPGRQWDDSIQHALNEAHGLIVILSNASIKSQNVMDEVSYALSRDKKVVPLMIEECEIPFRLARIQHIDFTKDYNASFKQLIATLQIAELEDGQPNNILPQSNTNKSKRPLLNPITISIIIALVIVASFIVFFINNKKSDTDQTMAIQQQDNNQNDLPSNIQEKDKPKVADDIKKNDPVNVTTTGDINLFDIDKGAKILVASNDYWKITIDGDEDYNQIDYGVGKEAVFGFKDGLSATFNKFNMLINETDLHNVKEFQLFYGNESPTGTFESIGKFTAQNLKLFEAPYQAFTFPPVNAKYFKFKIINTFGGAHPIVWEFQLWGRLN